VLGRPDDLPVDAEAVPDSASVTVDKRIDPDAPAYAAVVD
jgi:hypothetical protein